MSRKVELAFECDSDLGEGPIWDDRTQELIWLDVTQGKIRFYSPMKDDQFEVALDRPVGSLALTQGDDLWLALRDGFGLYSRESSAINSFIKVVDSPEIRFNDGAVDARGRFLAGTMGYNPEPHTGSLYTFTPESGYRVLLPEVGVSNGICWNKNSSQMFFVDSLTQSIQKYDYELGTGSLSNPTVLIKFEEGDGVPDGLTIDQEGSLWVAMWGGSQILKINSSGHIVESFHLPVTKVTSMTFGGGDLQDLYITTARYELSARELSAQPLAGSLFRVRTEVPGFPENRMK